MKALKTFLLSLFLILSMSGMSWLFIGSSTATFDPTSIASVKAWWRSDSLTISGSDILTLVDKSGNSNTLTFQSGRRPTLSAGAGPMGRDRMVFCGSCGGNFGSSNLVTQTSGLTFAMVWQSANPVVNNPMVTNLRTENSLRDFRFQLVPAVAGYSYLTLSLVGASTINVGYNGYGSQITNLHTLIIQYVGSNPDTAGSWTVTVDGTDRSVITDANALGSPFNVNSIGTPNPGTAGYDPAGYHYDISIYNAVLSGPEKAGLLSYYASYYGL